MNHAVQTNSLNWKTLPTRDTMTGNYMHNDPAFHAHTWYSHNDLHSKHIHGTVIMTYISNTYMVQ